MKKVSVVIGKNFGDEGKGLAVNFLCETFEKSIVIKHNGGGQAGHTVELPDKRFVFHQLSSGSFQKSDTLWASTYYPDLFKLRDEISDFSSLAGYIPKIYSEATTSVVIIYDVILNMILESLRGDSRHGSCGMGINEADLRTKEGLGISISEVQNSTIASLFNRLTFIRDTYCMDRLSKLGITDIPEEYKELLYSDDVLKNAIEGMKLGAYYVTVIEDVALLLRDYTNVIFETGQGLLLDGECTSYQPHVTASRTGLTNPVLLAKKYDISITDVWYISRSYVTRHGAGPLPYECDKATLGNIGEDMTNVYNDWQGHIRYAPHCSIDDFVKYANDDLILANMPDINVNLLITHLNETNNVIKFYSEDISISKFNSDTRVNDTFAHIYISDSRYGNVQSI